MGHALGVDSTYTGNPATFTGVADATATSVITTITPVQSGTGDPSPSNVRPITGKTDLTLFNDPVLAENIVWTQLASLDESKWDTLRAAMSFSGTKTTITPTTSSSVVKQVGLDLENGHYYLVSGKYITAESNRLLTLGFYYGGIGSNTYDSRNQISYTSGGPDISFSMAFHCQRDDQQFRLVLASAATTEEYATIENLQVYDLTAIFPESQDRVGEIYDDEIATEGAGLADFRLLFPHDYYQYDAGTPTCISAVNGDPHWQIDCSWDFLAGTVYGGSIDLATGVLTVNLGRVDLGALGWQTSSTYVSGVTVFYATISNAKKGLGSTVLCDSYKYVGARANLADADKTASRYNTDQAKILVRDDSYSTASDFKTSVDGKYLVYELATPRTYQLEPKQLYALVGNNKVWSSIGNAVTVSLRSPLTGFSGWLIKAVTNGTPVEIPLKYIRAETYTVTPDQRMEWSAERDVTGVLHRETVANLPPKIEFNTPLMPNSDINTLNGIIKAALTDYLQRNITIQFYDPERDQYWEWDCYMPDVKYTIRMADVPNSTIHYEQLRYAFIGY